MKRKTILKILTVMLAFCMSVIFVGCGRTEGKTIEDYIPETLGAPEGLYLYYDNYRCLTDGTQTERLLNDITVDGVTYTADEYSISDTVYLTEKKEIFYSIKTQKDGEEEKFFLWHYNYDTKESGLLRVSENSIFLYGSEKYVFARMTTEHVLYDGDLNLVLDGLSGYQLKDDVAYKTNEKSFEWWKDGRFFCSSISGDKTVINGKYAYLLGDTFVYAIDLDTGEYWKTDFEKGEYFFDSLENSGRTVETGDTTYFITYTKETAIKKLNEVLKTGCRLWSLQGLKAEKIYTFPKKYEVSFSYESNAEYLDFIMLKKTWIWYGFDTEPLRIWGWMACYDLQNNELDKYLLFKPDYLSNVVKTLRVGEYEFYVDYETYGVIMPEDFYYLHRVKDGKDEIMLYAFPDGGLGNLSAVLFDDIYIK